MDKNYTAIIKKTDKWWIGWIEEVPGVNWLENSRSELLSSLKETLIEALELNRQEAISVAGKDFEEETIALWREESL